MPHPSQPHSYAQRILVVISGESPQVITETIYALSRGKTAYHPTRTIVITTEVGRRRAAEALWGESAQLARLVKTWKLPDPGLSEADIRVPMNAGGEPDEDAHSEEALDRMGNLILSTLLECCRDGASVHVSLAGGRKTMSYLAGLALSLVGRAQDRLSHVVLSDVRFERCRAFYFPPKPAAVLELDTRDPETGQRLHLSTKGVEVRIVDVVFVRLRELLGEGKLVDNQAGRPLTELALNANAAMREPENPVVEINTYEGTIRCNKVPVRFTPAQLAFYYFLARRGRDGMHSRASDDECVAYLEAYSHVKPGGAEMREKGSYLDSILRTGEALFGRPLDADGIWPPTYSLGKTAREELFAKRGDKFNPDLSHTNQAIKRALGTVAARPFQIQSQGGRYLFPEGVQIKWLDERPVNEWGH
jgi:CRISPR-associated protein (TIGR02584 family)